MKVPKPIHASTARPCLKKKKKTLRGQSELQDTLKKQTNKQTRISEKGGKRESNINFKKF